MRAVDHEGITNWSRLLRVGVRPPARALLV
jgi:hypothetical protein